MSWEQSLSHWTTRKVPQGSFYGEDVIRIIGVMMIYEGFAIYISQLLVIPSS